jgi:hypothetical protein
LKEFITTLGAGFGWGVGWVSGLPLPDMEYLMDFISDATGYVYAYPPEVDDLTPEYFRERANKKLMPLGIGISPSFMQLAAPSEIIGKVRDYIKIGRNGITPLILVCGCIGPKTPVENVRALVSAVNFYGAPGADMEAELDGPGAGQSFEAFLKDKMKNNTAGYSFDWLKKSGYSKMQGF